MKRLLSSLILVMAMAGAVAQVATPLHVSMRECTGSAADRLVTCTPLDGVLGFYGTNIVPAQEFRFRSSGGEADTNLVVGNYRFSFSGSTKSMQIFWPADPAITNLSDPRIQRTGITLVYTTYLTNQDGTVLPLAGGAMSGPVTNGSLTTSSSPTAHHRIYGNPGDSIKLELDDAVADGHHFTGDVYAEDGSSFNGSGAGLTAIAQSGITGLAAALAAKSTTNHPHAAGDTTSGTFADARLSSNVPLRDGNNVFTGSNTIPGYAVSFTNSQVLYVDTNSAVSGVRGVREKPYRTLTNALANAQPGDTVQFTAGQWFDCGTNGLTLSNITIVANGATLAVTNGPNVLFTITGPVDWFGGKIRDLGVATDASAIMFPFSVSGTTAFTNNFHNLIIRSRTDAFNIAAGSGSFRPTINFFGCDFENLWDVFTCSSPQANRCRVNGIGSRFCANATLHTGSFGTSASIISAGQGYDFTFTGCTFICSNSTATCYGLLADVNSTFTLAGNSYAFDTAAVDSEPLFAGDNGAIRIDGHPIPDSYIVSGSGLPSFRGDATNAFAAGAFITARANGDRYWTTDAASLVNVPAASIVYYTNSSTMAPDFSKPYSLISTNAAFTVLAPISVDSGKTKAQTTVFMVTNSTAAAVAITPPSNCHTQGVWNVTNLTSITFFQYGGAFTNAIALPLF
jgi:hypothetical protein